MESHTTVWGLDIGHTSIKAVKLSRNGDDVVVLGYSIEPIAVGDDVDRDEAVSGALKSPALREEIGNTPVVTALSGRQIFARTINIPIINPKKVDKIVELEARQQIPGNFDEVRWGYHLSPSVDGASYDVALFACRNEIIDDLIEKTKAAGLNLTAISVTSLAVYNYVQFDQDFSDDETVMVLDVGAENTDLVVYKGDTLWMRNLSVSGNDITRAFQKKFRVSFQEAEQLKCQVGESRQAEKIFKVIEGSIGELVSEVQRSLGFYKSTNSEAEFECTVVSGNTFRLPNLTQYVADRLGYAVITLVEMERIKVDPMLDRDHFLEDLQSLGTAVGLGLQGIGTGKASVNLLPSSLRLQSLLKSKRWAAIAILLLIPLAFVATYMVQDSRLQTNYSLTQEIKKHVVDNKKKEKVSLDVINQIPGVAKQTREYANYLAHVGTLRSVEEGVFGIVEEMQQEVALLTIDDTDSKDGGSPHIRPVYFESLSVPYQRATGVDGFKPLAKTRRVTVVFRIPEQVANQQAIRSQLKSKLAELRASRDMWRAANPGASEDQIPADDDLPRLFKNVETRGEPASQDYYYYFDPKARTAFGDLDPSRQQQKRDVKVKLQTFDCYFGSINELPALGG